MTTLRLHRRTHPEYAEVKEKKEIRRSVLKQIEPRVEYKLRKCFVKLKRMPENSINEMENSREMLKLRSNVKGHNRLKNDYKKNKCHVCLRKFSSKIGSHHLVCEFI